MDAGQIVVRLLADARALDSGLMSGERRIASFSKRVTRTGDGMTKGLTVPIVAAGAVMTHFALDFEHQLALIGSLVGTNRKQLGQYRQAILDLGPAVGKSPTELAKALYFITSSGFKGAAALRVLEASAKASAAGLGDTAVVADAVTSAVNAYGEKALSASKATDIMLAAVREGKAEPEALAQSIGMVIPAASQLGVSFDQVSAALASMTLTGQSASEAAVALNQVFMNSLKPTKQGADTLKTVGMSYADLRDSLKNKGLLPTLDLLNEKFDGNVETMAKVFGNVRSLRAVLALTGAAADKTAGVFGKLAQASGDTDKAFAAMKRNDPGFELRQDWAELQKVMIEFGEVILPMFTDLAREGTKLVEWFDGLDEGSKKVVVGIAGIVAVIGPSLSLIGRMGTGVSTLVGLFNKLTGATKAAAGAQVALNAAQGLGAGKAGKAGAAAAALGSAYAPGSYQAKMAKAMGMGGGATAGSYSGAAGMSASSVAAIVAVALSPIVISTIMQKTQKYEEGRSGAGATSQQNKGAGGAFYGSSKGYGAGSGKFKGDASAAAEIQGLIDQLTIHSGIANGALEKTFKTIENIKKAAEKGIDLHINEDLTLAQMYRLRSELINELDLTGKEADAVLKGIFGKKYKVPKPDTSGVNKAVNHSEEQVNRLKSRLSEVGNMHVTPSVVVKTSGTEQLGYIKEMIAGIQSKTVTLSILKDYGYKPEALGGSYVLNRAQRFLAGEKSKEIATFIPLNDPARAAQVYGQLQGQLAAYMPSVFGRGAQAGGGARGVSGAPGGTSTPVIYAGPQTVEMPVYLDGELIAAYVRDLDDTSEARDGRGHA